ncbi:hypothetical protein BV911_02405 [Pseudoruegeria sp. SK021]|nr:hypothetical protein BV911_02405 [Pseudoruegeria sp. SK021]
MRCAAGVALAVAAVSPAVAQNVPGARTELSFYGLPGLIDMPTADMMPDAEIAMTISTFAGMTRGTLAFQIAPRLVGSFRYSSLDDWNAGGFSTYYDRSFDLRFQAITETATRPSVTIGLQDFIGTGIYSGEFIAATKTFSEKYSATGGIGWGRLGSNNSFGSTGTRPEMNSETIGTGGQFNTDTWFRGDMALFGGIAYRPAPKWTLKAEYSSDAYTLESDQRGIFDVDMPFNFGVEYEPGADFRVGAYALYGTEVGVNLQLSLNPSRPSSLGSLDRAPAPVLQRPSRASAPEFYSTGWTDSDTIKTNVREQLTAALRADGMDLEALELEPYSVTLYLRNLSYQVTPQAIGRAARLMSRILPSSIETFTIVQMAEGLTLPSVTMTRTDIETYETQPDGAEQMLRAASIDPHSVRPKPDAYAPGLFPRYTWAINPYVRTSLFDPDNPLRADFGLSLGGNIEVAPGLLFGASVQKKLAGNLDESTRDSDSTLPHVRSDFPLYDKNGDPSMAQLYGSYFFQPADDVYGAVTVGYLERMYAGVSSEMLWAPVNSRLALGAQLNYTQQRDYDGGFGLLDYQVMTGFGSAYWQFDDQYFAQVDVGRYLAGDIGTTLSLARVFNNGWRIGAFATFTDVSAEEYGEGSFDKGITMTIPLNWFLGKSSRVSETFGFRPLTRDGGAKLEVPQRLYPLVEPGNRPRQDDQWGSFWR